MFQRIWAIAQNTFRESIRDRILFVVVIFAIFIIGSSLFLGSISLDQDRKIIKDFGLTAIFLLQIFIIIFVGANLIYKEVERKTFFMILAKPIKRSEVILGKWLGLSFTVFSMTLLASLLFFGVLFFKTNALSDIPQLLLAIILGFVEAMLIIMLSVLFSGFTSPVLSSIYTASLFLIGHSSSVVLSIINKQENAVAKYVLSALYYIFPNLEKFNLRNEAIYNFDPTLSLIVLSLVYAFAYGLILFIIARFIFERREY